MRLEGATMRWFHLSLIVLFVAATAIFATQNLQEVNVSFLGLSFRTPLAFLIVAVYVLGAVSGGGLLAVVRRSYEGAKIFG